MYFPKPAINENDLAIIERGDTAGHSIEAGQYVSWKGKLGKANSAILQGATLDDSLFDYETDGVLNHNVKIISGQFRMNTGSVTSVSFGITFLEPPIVVLSDGTDYPGAASINFYKVTSTTTTGFTLRAERSDGGSYGCDPVWKAIGYT